MPNYLDNMNKYTKKRYTGWLKPLHLIGSRDMKPLELNPDS